jgi:hypothetical protein
VGGEGHYRVILDKVTKRKTLPGIAVQPITLPGIAVQPIESLY